MTKKTNVNPAIAIVLFGILIIAAVATFYFVVLDYVEPEGQQQADAKSQAQHVAHKTETPIELSPKIKAFCADCHVMPRPSSFDKESWVREVQLGFNFYVESGRQDLEIPSFDEVLEYFQSNAPEKHIVGQNDLQSAEYLVSNGDTTMFSADKSWHFDIPITSTVANVNFLKLSKDAKPSLVYCDMRDGSLGIVNSQDGFATTIGNLENPAHAETCDLNRDGKIDLVVSDLGSFLPEDHNRGRVIWLEAIKEAQEYKTHVLLDGIGRVCDVRTGDFDQDGDQDLIVAEFGWRKTGSILYLENKTGLDNQPVFESRQIDSRHGCINVIPIDLNGDQHLDFIALMSQEYESVEVFLNDGKSTFENKILFAAPDPAYGSSGIELVDLDRDGDVDILYSNGDSFDSFEIKSFHSAQWLENKGDLKFEHHHIGKMPGIHKIIAADLDLDQDLDLIAVALLPTKLPKSFDSSKFDSITAFINDGRQQFSRFAIEKGAAIHTSCFAADFDNDQDIDIAVGTISIKDTKFPKVNIWWNQLRGKQVSLPVD